MKVVVITGITRGIGYAIAQRFDQEGWKIVGCAKNSHNIAHLHQKHPKWDVQRVDFQDNQAVKQWAAYLITQYPSIEVLINNVGIFIPGKIHEEKEGTLETLLQVNLIATYYLTRVIVQHWLSHEPKGKTIINMGSTASIKGYPNGGSYCISKHALLGFSRTLREELKNYGIRVCCLLPGPVYTDSWKESGLPPKRFIAPEAIAALCWQIAQMPEGTVVESILIRPQLGDL